MGIASNIQRLFGFQFQREEPAYLTQEPVSNSSVSFVDRDSESTAAVVSSSFTSGMFVDFQGTIKAEADLVTKYRDMCTNAEVDNAVDEITNEAITTEDDFIVKLDLSKVTTLDDKYKKVLEQKHDEILDMLDFRSKAYWIFRRWYVDGRLYYHAVIDDKAPQEGIKELRYIDPRKIREIREVEQKPVVGGVDLNAVASTAKTKVDYYLYNDRGFGAKAPYQVGFGGMTTQGIRISKDSVVNVNSGIADRDNSFTIGYMTKAIKPLSQLKTIEDALIIYRLARAPERRVWYVDVGSLPKPKAEQAVRDVMINQKNKLIYDSSTGAIQDSRKFLTMTEDYWLPRRSDGSGTRVEPLPGGQNLGQMDDVLYFQKLLYNSLNVPIDRLQSDSPFSIGDTQEISRAEIKFNKFVKRLQSQFSLVFREALKKHVILQGLMSLEEFEIIEKQINYDFAVDSHFAELKDQLILQRRAEAYGALQQTGIIGKYVSNKWVRRNVFQQTDDDIQTQTEEIMEEMNDPVLGQLYSQPMPGEDTQLTDANGDPVDPNAQQEEGPPEDQLSPADQEAADKDRKSQQAQTMIKAINAIPVEKRTPGDSAKLRSAAQIAAKAAK